MIEQLNTSKIGKIAFTECRKRDLKKWFWIINFGGEEAWIDHWSGEIWQKQVEGPTKPCKRKKDKNKNKEKKTTF